MKDVPVLTIFTFLNQRLIQDKNLITYQWKLGKIWNMEYVISMLHTQPISTSPLNQSPLPGDTRRYYEASNDITNDVMINQ